MFYLQPTEHIDKQVGMFTNEEMMMATCFICGDGYPDERKVLGYRVCLFCGEEQAQLRFAEIKKQSAPMNKSNYLYISDAEFVKQLNPKRTT
jgi:hypothetical protein